MEGFLYDVDDFAESVTDPPRNSELHSFVAARPLSHHVVADLFGEANVRFAPETTIDEFLQAKTAALERE